MEITSLFARLGFNVDKKGINDFQQSLQTLQGGLKGLKTLIGIGITTAIYQFTSQTMDAVVSLDKFNKATGISIDTLQEWQLVAERNNVSKEVISNTFQKISQERSNILKGGKPNNFWYLLGIDPTGNPEKTFDNLLEKIDKIKSPQMKARRLQDLGLSTDLINLSGKSKDDYKNYVSSLSPLNQKQREEILKLKSAFNDLFIALKLLKDYVVYLASPFKWFIELISRIIHIFGTFIKAITDGKTESASFISMIMILIKILNPVKLIIMAIILVIEDLWVYFHKGDSVIGGLVQRFPQLAKWLEVLKIIILSLVDLLKYTFTEGLSKFFGVLGGIFEGLIKLIKSVFETINTFLIKPIKWVIDKLSKFGGWMGKIIDNGRNEEEYKELKKPISQEEIQNKLKEAEERKKLFTKNLTQVEKPINTNTINNTNSKSNIDNKQITNNININTNEPEKVKNALLEITNKDYNESFNKFNS